MSDMVYLILSIYDMKYDEINKIAVSIKIESIGDCIEHIMEKDCRKLIFDKLPEHIQEIGPIVHIERISDMLMEHL